MTKNFLGCALLGTVLISVGSVSADDGRANFRRDLLKLSAAGNILACVNKVEKGVSSTYPDGFTRNENYSLAIGELGAGGFADAYMIEFQVAGETEFSTMIAYEGAQGYVMGTIKVAKDAAGDLVQIHDFNGAAFTDETRVTESVAGLTLTYTKSLPGGPLAQTITCAPLSQ